MNISKCFGKIGLPCFFFTFICVPATHAAEYFLELGFFIDANATPVINREVMAILEKLDKDTFYERELDGEPKNLKVQILDRSGKAVKVFQGNYSTENCTFSSGNTPIEGSQSPSLKNCHSHTARSMRTEFHFPLYKTFEIYLYEKKVFSSDLGDLLYETFLRRKKYIYGIPPPVKTLKGKDRCSFISKAIAEQKRKEPGFWISDSKSAEQIKKVLGCSRKKKG